LKQVLEILNRVVATPGKNDKIAILKTELACNPLLQKVAKYALDQGKAYNVTTLNLEVDKCDVYAVDHSDLFNYLDYLTSKRGASQQDIDTLSSLCLDEATEEVVHKIINHDLKIGAQAESFNKAMPGLIYEMPYNRYSSFAKLKPEKLAGERLIVQLKNDGRFAYMQDPETTSTPFCSRQGIVYNLMGHLVEDYAWVHEMQYNIGENVRLEGEMLILSEDGKSYLPRKTGNGYIEKIVRGDVVAAALYGPRIRYVVWGYVTESDFALRKSTTIYSIIWDILEDAYQHRANDSAIILTRSIFAPDYSDAMDFYRKLRALGYEGAMLKVADKLVWKDNSSGNLNGFKMKAEAEAEFEIIDAYYGAKGDKWEHLLGGLLVATSDRKILTRIGGGFTDKERELGVDWWLGKKGKIITGKFTDISTDRTSRETFCLEHSRLPNTGGEMVETRFSEKEIADTYAYCVEQLKVA
jgi:hypothetical protein